MARINRYEGSCHKSRAHVSIVTRTRINRYEPPMMVAGDAHWPTTTSTPPDIDIDTARQRHRYRPMRMGNDSRGRCQPSLRGMQWYGYKSRKGVVPFQVIALCVKSWCRIFPRTISGISDTNLSAAPAHGRLVPIWAGITAPRKPPLWGWPSTPLNGALSVWRPLL